MKILLYILYWLVQCTWGIVMNIIGGVGALALLIGGKKFHHIGPVVYCRVGHNWGGATLGAFVFMDEEAPDRTLYHECGHTLQNLILGPLFPFVVAIPSGIRYQIRSRSTKLKKDLFTVCLLFSVLFVGILFTIFGILYNITPLTIIAHVIFGYDLALTFWLLGFELPHYLPSMPYYEYDAIWFEGTATKWGTKVFGNKKEG